MANLPTAEQIKDIDFCIDEGRCGDAIKTLRNITGLSLPKAKHIIELRTNGPRLTMDSSGVLNAYDGLWEYFKFLPDIQKMHEARDELRLQSIAERDNNIRNLEEDRSRLLQQLQDVTNERDEYKSRLNAMRITAGLEPLATQTIDNVAYDSDSIQSIKDPEIRAMDTIIGALCELDPEARSRVLDYLQRRFE